jgi:hypothetical protein
MKERLASEDCYVFIKGHKREEGTEIANTVAKLLDGYFTGEIYHGYNPDTLKVMFYGTMPTSKSMSLLSKIEAAVQDLSKHKLQVSLEIP